MQFDDVCLMAALSMMEKSELGDPARGNPLLVVKALSRVVGTHVKSLSNFPPNPFIFVL